MAHTIEVRKIPFEFTDDIAPAWHPTEPQWSHMVNGASLTMPYLEPFLNRTMRAALEHIDDPELRTDVDGFFCAHADAAGASFARKLSTIKTIGVTTRC